MEKISLSGTKEYKEIIMKNSVAEAGEVIGNFATASPASGTASSIIEAGNSINGVATESLLSAMSSSIADTLTSRLHRREYSQQLPSQGNLTLQFDDLETARQRRYVAPGTMIFDPMERELYINVGLGRWRRIETSAVDI